jgi:hypothetical protein
LFQDLLRYYNYSNIDLNRITSVYDSIYSEFWSIIQTKSDQGNSSTKIKLVNPQEGKYNNIIKIDFKRAFTNYGIRYLDKEALKLYMYFCNKVSRSYILPESKKFLYNYVLTNIITNYSGKEQLNLLRANVYDDVLYLASRYGEVIKSEVDGCYVITDCKDYYNFEVFGEYNIVNFNYIYFIDKLQISNVQNKIVVKGIDKTSPNIYTMLITNFLKNMNDKFLNSFFFNPITTQISDWCKKSKDGNTGKLCLKNSIIDVDMSTIEKVNALNKYKDYISKNAYFNKLKTILTKIMLYNN